MLRAIPSRGRPIFCREVAVLTRGMFFLLFGYLSGSILFAQVAAKLLGKEDCFLDSKDQNPGTANAFLCGGFACGLLTLTGDLLKGWLPVHLYLTGAEQTMQPELALVLAAPVLGTAFPLFHHFRGGKGIAVTFGCLLGLLPLDAPLIIFVGLFLFFSLVVRVQPHFYRTIVVYLLSLLLMVRMHVPTPICTGFGLISLTVCYKLHRSKEIREKMKVQILWKH